MPLSNPLHPETVGEIRTLHRFVEEHQWVEKRHYCGRGCNCYEGTTYDCPSCGNNQEQGHTNGCELGISLLNIGTFLDMQEEAHASSG